VRKHEGGRGRYGHGLEAKRRGGAEAGARRAQSTTNGLTESSARNEVEGDGVGRPVGQKVELKDRSVGACLQAMNRKDWPQKSTRYAKSADRRSRVVPHAFTRDRK
jgi:hypothetical protein